MKELKKYTVTVHFAAKSIGQVEAVNEKMAKGVMIDRINPLFAKYGFYNPELIDVEVKENG